MLTRRRFAGLFATTMLTSGDLARSAAAQPSYGLRVTCESSFRSCPAAPPT